MAMNHRGDKRYLIHGTTLIFPSSADPEEDVLP